MIIFKCSECGKEYTSKTDYNNHLTKSCVNCCNTKKHIIEYTLHYSVLDEEKPVFLESDLGIYTLHNTLYQSSTGNWMRADEVDGKVRFYNSSFLYIKLSIYKTASDTSREEASNVLKKELFKKVQKIRDSAQKYLDQNSYDLPT